MSGRFSSGNNTNKYPSQFAIARLPRASRSSLAGKTINFIFLFAILIIQSSFPAIAQTAPLKQWDVQFGGSDFDQLNSLQQTADGGYILGGNSRSGISGDKTQPNRGGYDYWIVKTDANGGKQWDASFGGSYSDLLYSLQQTADGGYILGGYSSSGISGDKTQASRGDEDYWIVKTDANGVKQWDATFGGSSDDYLYSVQQTADGGYILGGSSESGISGDKTQASQGEDDYWIVKTDANGIKQWDATFGGSSDDYLYSLQKTSDGGYILGGSSESGISGDKTQTSQGEADYWIVKTDANGVKQWDAQFGGSSSDGYPAFSLQQTADGGYILGGSSESGISGDKTQASRGKADYWIVKTDANGAKQWDAGFGGSSNDGYYAFSIRQTADGGYILGESSLSKISGDKTQDSQGEADYWIVKTDANGVKQWDAGLGGSMTDYLNSLHQTADGGYILGGSSESGISGDKTQESRGKADYWIVKLNFACSNVYYIDADGDGYGDLNSTAAACSAPAGYVADNTDCNDSDPVIHPDASDVCNGIDDNCDGNADENAITATVIPSGTVAICEASSIALSANSGTGITYQWIKGSNNISGATNQTYSTNKAAGYKVIVSNSFGCSSTSAVTIVNVNPSPPASISYTSLDLCGQSSVTLSANSGTGLSYQWLKGGSHIIGATNRVYSANKKGNYKVIVTNSSGCTKTSANVTVTKSCKESSDLLQQISFQIYPNPAEDHATIQFKLPYSSHVSIKVYGVSGKEIATLLDDDLEQGDHSLLVNTNHFSKGVYLVKMISPSVLRDGIANQKLIVQ